MSKQNGPGFFGTETDSGNEDGNGTVLTGLSDPVLRVAVIMMVFALVWSVGLFLLLAYASAAEMVVWLLVLLVAPWVVSYPVRHPIAIRADELLNQDDE